MENRATNGQKLSDSPVMPVVLTMFSTCKPECGKPCSLSLMSYALIFFWLPSDHVCLFPQVEVTKFGIDKKNMFAFWDVSNSGN